MDGKSSCLDTVLLNSGCWNPLLFERPMAYHQALESILIGLRDPCSPPVQHPVETSVEAALAFGIRSEMPGVQSCRTELMYRPK